MGLAKDPSGAGCDVRTEIPEQAELGLNPKVSLVPVMVLAHPRRDLREPPIDDLRDMVAAGEWLSADGIAQNLALTS